MRVEREEKKWRKGEILPISIDTKDVRWLLYDIVISGWNLTISIDTKYVRQLLYVNRNRVYVVGFEINLDVSR